MTKNEFLQALRTSLTGKIDQADVESNISYYSSYIDEEMRGGKTEEQVVEELGNPRIIAKNITDAAERRGNVQGSRTYYQEGPQDGSAREGYSGNGDNRSTAVKVITTVVMVVILMLIIIVFWRVGFFLLRLILPIIAILLIAGLVIGLTRRR